MNAALFSSKKDDWTTPPELFAELDREFHFTTDAAANIKNHLCPEYWTPETDALTQNWGGQDGVLQPAIFYKGAGRFCSQSL